MATKPAQVPEWNSGVANNVEPNGAKKILGWVLNEIPPSSTFNWLQEKTFRWLEWTNEKIYDVASVVAGRLGIALKGSSGAGVLEFQTLQADADNALVGIEQWHDLNSVAADKRIASIAGITSGATANNRGGKIVACLKTDAASGLINKLKLSTEQLALFIDDDNFLDPQNGVILDGEQARTIKNKIRVSGNGSSLTLAGGSAGGGGSNLVGGDLIALAGASTGNRGSSFRVNTSLVGAAGPGVNGASPTLLVNERGQVGLGNDAASFLTTLNGPKVVQAELGLVFNNDANDTEIIAANASPRNINMLANTSIKYIQTTSAGNFTFQFDYMNANNSFGARTNGNAGALVRVIFHNNGGGNKTFQINNNGGAPPAGYKSFRIPTNTNFVFPAIGGGAFVVATFQEMLGRWWLVNIAQ
jgi:hypothetical protein